MKRYLAFCVTDVQSREEWTGSQPAFRGHFETEAEAKAAVDAAVKGADEAFFGEVVDTCGKGRVTDPRQYWDKAKLVSVDDLKAARNADPRVPCWLALAVAEKASVYPEDAVLSVKAAQRDDRDRTNPAWTDPKFAGVVNLT